MERPVIVWRESVYKNDFRCNICKKKLANDGEPIPEALNVAMNYPEKGQDTVICKDCNNAVAVMSYVETKMKPGKYGNINDYMKGDKGNGRT